MRELGLACAWLSCWLDLPRQEDTEACDRPARGIRPALITAAYLTGLLQTGSSMTCSQKSQTTPLWSCVTLATRLKPMLSLKALAGTLHRQLAQLGISAPIPPWQD